MEKFHSVKFVLLTSLIFLLSVPLLGQWRTLAPPFVHNWGQPFPLQIAEDGTIWQQYSPFIPPYVADIHRSTDQGESWDTIPTPFAKPVKQPWVYATFALDANQVWVINGRVDTISNDFVTMGFYASSNGGTSWDTLTLPPIDVVTESIEEVHFYHVDTGIVFVSGFFAPIEEGRAYRTVDGGQTWVMMEMPLEPFENLQYLGNDSYVYRGDTIWTGTTQGRVARSLNRGQDWEMFMPVGADSNLVESIAFQDHLNGIITIRDFSAQLKTTAYRTEDGGASWKKIAVPPRTIKVTHVPGSGGVYLGVIGGNLSPGYFISKDGGTRWERSPDLDQFVPIVFASPTVGYAASINVTVIGAGFNFPFFPLNEFRRYEGPPLLADGSDPDFSLEPQGLGLLPDDYIVFSLSAVDSNCVWGSVNPPPSALAEDAPVYVVKTTDGGANWERFAVPGVTGRASYDVYGVDDQKAFITTNDLGGGSGKALLRTMDGGVTWTPVLEGLAGGVWVHFFDASAGICINASTMAYTTDGGMSWVVVPPDNIPALQAGEFTLIESGTNSLAHYGDNLWFGTSLGSIYHSADRGLNWKVLDVLGTNITSISFKNELEGMAISPTFSNRGFNIPNDIFVTADGGESWVNINNDEDALQHYGYGNISYVPGTAGSYIITTNESDNLILYTLNDGEDWFILPDASQFRAIEMLDPHNGFISFGSTVESGVFPSVFRYKGDLFERDPSVSIAEAFTSMVTLTVYPNPTVDRLNCQLPTELSGEPLLGTIIDQNGRILRQMRFDSSPSTIGVNTADLPNGFYYLVLESRQRRLLGKFFKQE